MTGSEREIREGKDGRGSIDQRVSFFIRGKLRPSGTSIIISLDTQATFSWALEIITITCFVDKSKSGHAIYHRVV